MSSPGAPAVARPAARVSSRNAVRDALLERARDFLAGAGDDATLILALPAPAVAPETLLDLAPGVFPGVDAEAVPALVWDPPTGEAVAGLGVARHLRAEGDDRFRRLRRDADALFAGVETAGFDGLGELPPPRLWGGFAFDVGAVSSAPWEAFGEGELLLPRFLYVRSDGAGRISVALRGGEGDEHESLVESLLALRERLSLEARAAPPNEVESSATLSRPEGERERDDPDWIRRVEQIRGAIADGAVEKIVAARRLEVEVDDDLGVSRVLRRLARGLRASSRFAFRRDGAAFVGATPERLVTLRGRRVETEALAGSIEAGDGASASEHAAELLGSGKDRHEQQLVTDSIVRHLSPLCAELDVASRPTVRELRDVLHLHTPIRGVLAEDRHVLELVEALHPTPAVGGVPTPAARRWISEREGMERGWYAAPVGWIDAAGDGEFFVALRSCLIAGGKAHLYAGAGIVADSDPAAELRETRLKAQGLLAAVGA